jgi:predicted CoA-binding protein
VPFGNPPRDEIERLMRNAHTIAIVGLSGNQARPSYRVAWALKLFGYRIIPVNPALDTVLGEPAVPNLDAALAALKPGERIDIVDVFRRPEHVAGIVDDCIRLRLPALWLQDGVIDAAAAERARAAGIFTVMDRCLYRDRAALSVSS